MGKDCKACLISDGILPVEIRVYHPRIQCLLSAVPSGGLA